MTNAPDLIIERVVMTKDEIRQLQSRRKILFICCSMTCMQHEALKIMNRYPAPHVRFYRHDNHLVTPDEDIQFALEDKERLWYAARGREFHEYRTCSNVHLDRDTEGFVQSRVRLK